MTDFTIEQLEALKEGADSAPWRPEYDEGEEHWVIAFDHPKFGGRWDKGIAHGEGAAKLFAAAPALVDALIAEKRAHQKLRAGIEELRAECKTIVDDNGKGHESYEPNDVAALIEECHYNALTRILEATDD